ncbi:MAG: DUF4435 domain-containing protein [Microcoleus vaginatus WJT46-NPBG5]|jgi:hypothetical protein|nr:DUF4435 domain-containing protein [Microcoleus vaginatus WJT46-NPBG5]
MTRLDDIRQDRLVAPAKYLDFINDRRRKFGSKPIYCLFEGADDSKYYGIRIDTIISPVVSPQNLNCGGKKEVLRFHRIIKAHKEYQDTKFAYFIDRDFDESIRRGDIHDIYETPVYSIENFYTSINVFQKILENEFKLTPLDDDFKKCSELYQARQREFHQETKLLNAWVSCQRKYQHHQEYSGKFKRASLKDFKLDDHIFVSLDKVTSNYTLETLNECFSEAYHPTEDVIQQKLAEFDSVDCQKTFRGKFEIFFLFKFFVKLNRKKNSKYFSQKPKKKKVSLNISIDNIITTFSGYAETPNCLRAYLESFKDIENTSI